MNNWGNPEIPPIGCQWCHANLENAENVVEHPDGKGCDWAFCNEQHRDLWLNPNSIHNLREFADRFGCEPTEAALSKAIYRATDCGAWIKLETTENLHDTLALGSMVEGSDAETQTHRLVLPFEWSTYEQTIRAIENEVDALWHEAHGEDDDE